MGVINVIFLLVFLQTCKEGRAADMSSVRKNIEMYFSQPRHHAAESYKRSARTFIEAEFKRLGLETEVQNFTARADFRDVLFQNFIGVLKGERFGTVEDKILGVGAHYDSESNTPGVDSNGSGVAALLEVVRQVTEANKAGTKRKNTIIFASFDANDAGASLNGASLNGAQRIAKDWLDSFLDKNYGREVNNNLTKQGVIIMDTMMNFATTKKSQIVPKEENKGHTEEFHAYFPDAMTSIARDDYEGDFLMLTYRKPTADVHLANAFTAAWNCAGRPEFELEAFPLPLKDASEIHAVGQLSAFSKSDHLEFWRQDIPAILISDTGKYRGDMVICHRRTCDNIETMLRDDNLQFLGKTADVIASTLNTLSEADGTATTCASGAGLGVGAQSVVSWSSVFTVFQVIFVRFMWN